MILKDDELINIKGGAGKSLGYGIALFISGLIAFVAGVVDGYINPIKCRS